MLVVKCKKMYVIHLLLILLLFQLNCAKKYNVEIERATLHSFDDKVFKHWIMRTGRANRHSPYTLSINATVIKNIANNVTMHIKTYEKVNAEYKVTPLEIHLKVCEWLKHDRLFVPVISRYDVHRTFSSCPLKGDVIINELYIKSEDAPTGFWPFVKTKFDFTLYMTNTKASILYFSFYLSVIELPERKQKG